MNNQLMIDPMTGMPVQQNAAIPPVPGNELGYTKPVFSPQAQAQANGVFGDVQQKANSVSPLFKKSCGYKK